jgi:hypothetical protein
MPVLSGALESLLVMAAVVGFGLATAAVIAAAG